jgi:hypothetical protein
LSDEQVAQLGEICRIVLDHLVAVGEAGVAAG